MSIELGHFSLVLAVTLGLAQTFVGLFFWRDTTGRGNARVAGFVRQAAILQFILVGVSFFVLIQAFVLSDFSLALAQGYSHTLQPLIF